ncbi:MAG: DUF4430 domain-containing protein [Dehalobacterium sp.]
MKRITKSGLPMLIVFVLLLVLSVPVFAQDGPESTPVPSLPGVISITVNGEDAYFEQDDSTGSDIYIRAKLSAGSNEMDLREAEVSITLSNSGIDFDGGELDFTQDGATWECEEADLFNKAYEISIDNNDYTLAAGLVDGVVTVDSNDPLKIAPVTLEGVTANVSGFNVQNPYMGNPNEAGWTFINYYVTATLPSGTELPEFEGTMSLAGGASVTDGCATLDSGSDYDFDLSSTNEFVVENGSDGRTYYVMVGVSGESFIVTASDYTIDFQELKASEYYDEVNYPDIYDQVGEIEAALIEYYAEGPYEFPSGTSVMEIIEDFIDFAENEGLFSYDTSITYGGAYLAELNGLEEFDGGFLSGWMYSDDPNGYFIGCSIPMIGAASYYLNGGERITWFYTVDYTQHF